MIHHAHLESRLSDLAAGPLPSASVLNLLAGLYLAVCGWLFAPDLGRPGAVNAVAAGAFIALVAGVRIASGPERAWISWFNALLGGWTIASPWIFHFATGSSAAWNIVVTGLTAVVLACASETAPESMAAGAQDYHRAPGWDYPYLAPPARPGEAPV